MSSRSHFPQLNPMWAPSGMVGWVHTHIHLHTYAHTRMHLHTHTHTHIHTNTHTHTHTHALIYIYTHTYLHTPTVFVPNNIRFILIYHAYNGISCASSHGVCL